MKSKKRSIGGVHRWVSGRRLGRGVRFGSLVVASVGMLGASTPPTVHLEPAGPHWEVPLVRVQSQVLPQGSKVGDLRQWYRESQAPEWRVARSGGEVVVVAGIHDWFETNRATIRLRPEGVTAALEFASDVGDQSAPVDVGGCIWLVTDGTEAVLDFELYAIRRSGVVSPMVGRIALDVETTRALEALAQVASSVLRQETQYRQRSIVEGGVKYRSSGYVDGLGRRQGVWIVREDAKRLAEVEWEDGLVSGRVAVYRVGERLRSVVGYVAGFKGGREYIWTENGELQGIQSWEDGKRTEEAVWFYANGRKRSETVQSESGLVWRRWDSDGNLQYEGPADSGEDASNRSEWWSMLDAHHREIRAMRKSHLR